MTTLGTIAALTALVVCATPITAAEPSSDDAKLAQALALLKQSGIKLIRDEQGQFISAIVPTDFARTAQQPALALKALDSFQTVCEVDLTGCVVTKAMLSTLSSLSSVRKLQLAGAEFKEQDVEAPTTSHLEIIDLSGSNANDSLLSVLATQRHLRHVTLAGTQVTAAGLANLEKLSEIRELNLSRTKTMPHGGKHLRNLTALTNLDLSETGLSFDDLEFLIGLHDLKSLTLDRNKVVSESALINLDKLTNLRSLSLEGTIVSPKALNQIRSLKNLRDLRVRPSGGFMVATTALFELKKRLPNVLIASCVLREAGVPHECDSGREVTSVIIDEPNQPKVMNKLIAVGELVKLKAVRVAMSQRETASLEDLMLPSSVTRVDASAADLPAKFTRRITELPRLEALYIRATSIDDESRADLHRLAARAAVYLVTAEGMTRLGH